MTIASPLTNYPVLNAAEAVCKSLTIQSGASLDLATYCIDVHGNLDPLATNVILSTATALSFNYLLVAAGRLKLTSPGPMTHTISGNVTVSAGATLDRNLATAGIARASGWFAGNDDSWTASNIDHALVT